MSTEALSAKPPSDVPGPRDGLRFFLTWVSLMLLAASSLGLSYVSLGRASMAVAMVIAALKAGLVGAIFMDLRRARFTLVAVAGVSVLFVLLLGIGVVGDVAFR